MNRILKNLSGILVSLIVAILAYLISNISHLMNSSVLSLLIGLIFSVVIKDTTQLKSGLDFSSKKILKFSIVLLGATLSFSQILLVGKYSLIVMMFTLFSAYSCGYIFGKFLKVDWKLSSLIATGTGICGGSAIAAISPIIDADDSDISYAISSTFIFDMIMIILFPLMGVSLGLSDIGFGLWAGTAINDTSSVVAAAYSFSDLAGDYATIVKLTRTLSIIPISLIFVVIAQRQRSKNSLSNEKFNIARMIPYFIFFFAFAAVLNSNGYIPKELIPYLKPTSKFLMGISLAAIGLKTDIKKMFSAGYKPLLLGFIVSTVVVVVSILVQYLIAIV